MNSGLKRNRSVQGQDILTSAIDSVRTYLVTLKYLVRLMGIPINALISPRTI